MGIPQFIRKISVQTAVYWGSPADDGYGGFTFDSPVEIPVRWDEKHELITASNGEQIVTKAEIFVNQDVDVNGYLFLGNLTALSDEQSANPKLHDQAHCIRQTSKVPLIKSTTQFVRKAFI